VKISSPIGEYDYRVERVAFRGGHLEVLGRLGEWQTTTILDASDLAALIRKARVPAALAAALLAVTWRRSRV
jgi:hypothetical protein